MKRVNQYQFYRLGMILHPLSFLAENANVQQITGDLYIAKVWINRILQGAFVDLVVSREAALNLLNAIKKVLPDAPEPELIPPIDVNRTLSWTEAYMITNAVQQFETVFAAELPTIATYMVSKKGIYSTEDLTERAELAIDDDAQRLVSKDVMSDFNQAGRCLAFELPTAAGFHTMRATEAVLRQYWALVLKPTVGTKPPEMAQCINQLRTKGEDPKLMDVLDHIRDLHRNTIMHPEAFLTMTEALRLFDIAKSAISAMADRIKNVQP